MLSPSPPRRIFQSNRTRALSALAFKAISLLAPRRTSAVQAVHELQIANSLSNRNLTHSAPPSLLQNRHASNFTSQPLESASFAHPAAPPRPNEANQPAKPHQNRLCRFKNAFPTPPASTFFRRNEP